MSESKKDNSRVLLIIAAVCLVLSVGGKIAWENMTKSLVTDESVLAVTNPLEFAASIDGVYENGEVKFNVQTNAPDGTVLDILGMDTEGGDIESQVVVKRGVGSSSVKMDDSLSPGVIQSAVIIDMEKQANSRLAINRYGIFGEKIEGNNIATRNGTHVIAGSETAFISYPTEEAAKEVLNAEFQNFIYGLLLMNTGFFEEINPVDGNDWSQMNIVFGDEFVAESWDIFPKEQKEYIFELFDQALKAYKMVDNKEQVRINFMDTEGNILGKNY